MYKRLFLLVTVLLSATGLQAKELTYDLTIDTTLVNYSGKEVMAMTVNGGIPGPTIEADVGDHVTINVHNKMDVASSIHWHGILLPNRQDGVPYLTTPPIKAGQTLTYTFPLTHSGTYWYHSHTGLQEQRGVYGSIVVHAPDDAEQADREYVVVLSDWTDEDPNQVMRTLKRGSHYYALKKGAMQSIAGAIKANALSSMIQQSRDRMPMMDISDVAYDAFLTNGKKVDVLEANPGEIVRLRIINAGASTYFYTEYAAHRQRVIAADGIYVKPFRVKRNLIAIAETYDVTVKVPDEGLAEFRATAQDNSGYTSLFIGDPNSDKKLFAPDVPAPDLYNMHAGHSMMTMDMDMDMDMSNMQGMDHSMHGASAERPMSPYPELRALQPTTIPDSQPLREIDLVLNGDMNRYVWSFNNKTLLESDFIKINRGEKVRMTLTNETMMHHPMHLHGHFFRVLSEQGEYSPLKHTVDVPPMGKVIIEFDANEEKDWFFHCHVLYHMKAGMSRVFSYTNSTFDPEMQELKKQFNKKDHWYSWADVGVLSNMSDGVIKSINTRKTLMAKWESDWQNDYDVDLSLGHYYDRFLSTEMGVELSDSLEEEFDTQAYVAVNYLLPYLIESQLRYSHEGNARLSLEKEFQLTDRFELHLEGEYDSHEKEEWAVELAYTVNKKFDLVIKEHSEFGFGAGVMVRF
ncbi:MAG: multicopper oxidase domain-containing protein [Gammaproteobacteria bacterium]|nr:multicopper oxidase domain-containing protein [Gammaproteobacteria bacterium]